MSEIKQGMQAGNLPKLFLLKESVKRILSPTETLVIPPEDKGEGCDISHWEGIINYPILLSKSKMTYVKATQGITKVDERYNINRTGLQGSAWGSYHFLTNEDGTAQANHFCDFTGNDFGPLPPCVDVELNSVDSKVIYDFVVRVYQRTGKYCIIYTSAYYWSLVTGSYKSWLTTTCKLWVAHYGTDNPLIPTGWNTYMIHQWTANGKGSEWGVQSLSIDLDHVRLSWLYQFITPPPPGVKTINSKGCTINIYDTASGNDVGDAKLIRVAVINETPDWYQISTWVSKSVTQEN